MLIVLFFFLSYSVFLYFVYDFLIIIIIIIGVSKLTWEVDDRDVRSMRDQFNPIFFYWNTHMFSVTFIHGILLLDGAALVQTHFIVSHFINGDFGHWIILVLFGRPPQLHQILGITALWTTPVEKNGVKLTPQTYHISATDFSSQFWDTCTMVIISLRARKTCKVTDYLWQHTAIIYCNSNTVKWTRLVICNSVSVNIVRYKYTIKLSKSSTRAHINIPVSRRSSKVCKKS